MNAALQGHRVWVVWLSYLVAALLAIWPIPHTLMWVRPEWLALLVIYWSIACPQHTSLWLLWLLGLTLDVLEGCMLGQHPLALMGVAYVCLLSYQRLRNYVIWHQAFMVFIVVGIHQLIDKWGHSLMGSTAPSSLAFLLPALSSAIVWPALWLGMEALRRRLQVF